MVKQVFIDNVSAPTDVALAKKRQRRLGEERPLASAGSFVQLFHVAVVREMLSTTHIHGSDANMPAGT